jgi:hypothetical protein
VFRAVVRSQTATLDYGVPSSMISSRHAFKRGIALANAGSMPRSNEITVISRNL